MRIINVESCGLCSPGKQCELCDRIRNISIEIDLGDFDAWYKATYWRKEGGLIHYTSVSWYIKQWLASLTGEGK